MGKFNVVAPTEAHNPIIIKETPIDVPLSMTKPKEFEAFVLWCSIPVFFKRPPRDKKTGEKPTVREFLYSMGIEDDRVIELAELDTQKAFGDRFEVNEHTLVEWKQKMRERDLLADLGAWIEPLTRNVMMAHYNSCIRGGLPEHYKLWYQVAAKWSEKTQVDVNKRTISVVKVHIVDPKESA